MADDQQGRPVEGPLELSHLTNAAAARSSTSPGRVECGQRWRARVAGSEDLLPVGTLPNGNGRWHHSDLAGNVEQWALDWYAVYATNCTDCANLIARHAACCVGITSA